VRASSLHAPGDALRVKGTMRKLRVQSRHLEEMQAHVASCLPEEGCGLLYGRDGVAHGVLPITNELHSPTGFRMEPREQIRAFAAIEDRGLEMIGIFHSHPASGHEVTRPADELSETDVAAAAYPVANVLWSLASGQWAAKAYWVDDGQVTEVELVTGDE
jgi:proteasome lid subunit RPN8/RPN11